MLRGVGGVGVMSHEAVEWAFDRVNKVKPATKLVLLALAERANSEGGSCHPGITELTRRTGLSRRRVVEAIKELESSGAIRVERGKRKPNGGLPVNQYRLGVGHAVEGPGAASPSRRRRERGTTLVPTWNYPGSPGGTGTSTEPSLNHHSATYVAAPRETRGAQNEGLPTDKSVEEWPDRSMWDAALKAGFDPADLCGHILNWRMDIDGEVNKRKRKQLRTLWFAIIHGQQPDLAYYIERAPFDAT